jgi:hypothetical protein
MPFKNHIYVKNGYTTQYINNAPVASFIDWTLSFNMTTHIMIVSSEGQVFKVSFKDVLTTLFNYATQLSITCDALVFYVSLPLQYIQEFLSNNVIEYTEADFANPATQKIILDDTIRCVLTDMTNIDMFHMMSNCMMMDIDSVNVEDVLIDDNWWNDFMDVDFGIVS